jgi:cytidylate kinase
MDYFEETTNDEPGKIHLPGPVITISRECGCSSNRIAIKLAKILSGYSYMSETKKEQKWTWMNREIIEAAAAELEVNKELIKNVFLKEAKSRVHEITNAFSTEKMYDADDQEVIDSVVDVIRQMARKGHCVIVGRAAQIVTEDIPDRLNIKLQAPLEWRIRRIMTISNMSYSEAQEYVLEIDRQRNLFVKHIAGRELDNNDFDVIFNYSTMSDDLIVDAIINMLKNKKIIISA